MLTRAALDALLEAGKKAGLSPDAQGSTNSRGVARPQRAGTEQWRDHDHTRRSTCGNWSTASRASTASRGWTCSRTRSSSGRSSPRRARTRARGYNAYTFQVNPIATKTQIKAAVEELFRVRVEARPHAEPPRQEAPLPPGDGPAAQLEEGHRHAARRTTRSNSSNSRQLSAISCQPSGRLATAGQMACWLKADD